MEIIHKKKREIELPLEIVVENFLDLDHVNFVHKKCYSYCNILRRSKNIMLLDVGVKPLTPFPYTVHYTMFHEFISPNKIVHFSKQNGKKKYVKSIVEFNEERGKTSIIHTHKIDIPFYLIPLKHVIIKLVDRWSNILWKEDSEIMKDRKKVVSKGFLDGPHCGKWLLINGKPKWIFNKIK